jgi:hypothetical protein
MGEISYCESERIIAILEDGVEKLSFLGSLTTDVLQHRDELSKFIGEEIQRTMNEQSALEQRYEQLIEQRAAMKGTHNKAKYKEVQDEIQDISRALRESTNNLVRSLKENPNVSGNLIKVQRHRTELHDLLLRVIQEFRDRGTYHTIVYTVDEDNAARIKFEQLKAREKSLREAVEKLQQKLSEEQHMFQSMTQQQKRAITQLKDQLQEIKGTASHDSKFKRKESLAVVAAIWREFKLKEKVLEDRLAEKEDRMETEGVVHGETKEFLSRKLEALRNDISNWEGKYDSEIGAFDEKLTHLTENRESLLEKLHVLQSRKAEADEAERAQREAMELEIEVAKHQKALLKRQNQAARKIQKEMTAFLKRKRELEALAPKKGAKGGGGKKKK